MACAGSLRRPFPLPRPAIPVHPLSPHTSILPRRPRHRPPPPPSSAIPPSIHPFQIQSYTPYTNQTDTQAVRFSSSVLPPNSEMISSLAARTNKEGSWDMEDHTPEPLTLISAHRPTLALLTLPPTLTKIALVNLPNPVSLHRLPSLCPLLIILDLSFNTWLELEAEAEKFLLRVDWTRWSHLRVLRLRKCPLSKATHEMLNRGRWDDVEVIQ